MSEEKKTEEKSNALRLLESIDPKLTSRALADTAKTAESIDTVRFMVHAWVDLLNISMQGPKYGVNHPILKRLTLIPITTWKVPVFMPKGSGWAPGSFGTVSGGMGATHERPFGEFYPAGSVGPKISTRLQFPSESVANLIVAYGEEGLHDIGMRQLVSLAAQSDKDKVESILLFKAIMDPAQNVLLDRLPEYLVDDEGGEAMKLLEAACTNGVRLAGRVVSLSSLAPEKGLEMLADLRLSVQTGINQGLKILNDTKAALGDAKIGVKDVKRKLDALDKWLLRQMPSFSMDSELERGALLLANAQEANAGANAQSAMSLNQMIELQQQTLAALNASNETNRMLMERITQLPPSAPTHEPVPPTP